MIRVDGRTLRCADVVTAARTEGPLDIDVSIAAQRAAEHAWKLAEDLSTRRVVYGRTTGVGANKDDTVESSREHGLRLLRSHAGASGDVLPPGQVRAMLLIRLNQLLSGRSGISPELIGALAEAVRSGALPLVHRLGAIGTGDLAPLAETALAL
ncbi:aromatic amino acid lyase, partial [Amycolatopsis sp. SID8362]|uniref:aromatic amino acid lyase n=1 Tax=Amycolatopsis sp. SID8362 TaxID=2690346 RepID=UPI00136B61B2